MNPLRESTARDADHTDGAEPMRIIRGLRDIRGQNRRQFIRTLGGAAASLAAGAAWCSAQPAAPVVDFHVHLFGIGDGNTGCRLSQKQRRHINFRYFLKLLNLSENGRLDQDYVERLAGQVRASSLKQVVLQAWDGRYDQQGKLDWERTTSLYVPNDYLFKVVRQHPGLFVPCLSINPKRRDALDELDRGAALGAKVVKIHPPTMDVDPGEARFRPFYRRCAEQKIIVMAHTGSEHAADAAGMANSTPLKLALALEEGCTVIAAHAGMTAFFDKEDFFPDFVTLARRHPNLYCDTSILGSVTRWRCLRRLQAAPEALARAVHGSDFPFPSNALVFWNRLPRAELSKLLAERNLLERDYRLKQALGLPDAVFTRGAKLLGLAG